MVRVFGVEHGVHKVANSLRCGCGSDFSNMRLHSFKGKNGHLNSLKHKEWLLNRSQTGMVQSDLETLIREDTNAEAGRITVEEHGARARAVRAVLGAVGLALNGVCGYTPFGTYYRDLLRNQLKQPCDLPKNQSTLTREYVPLLLTGERSANTELFNNVRYMSCCIDGSSGMEVVVGRGVERGNSRAHVYDRIIDIAFVKGALDADKQPNVISNALGQVNKPVNVLKAVAMEAPSR